MNGSFLKVMSYISVLIAVLIVLLIPIADGSLWGALPYAVNAWAGFRYLNKRKFNNSELAIAACILMAVIAGFSGSMTDVIVWIVTTLAWLSSRKEE